MVTWTGDAVSSRSATFDTIPTKGGHRQAYTGIQKICKRILKDISRNLQSEVRPWKSDVRHKIREKYHSCGAKLTCATSKLTCAARISSVRQEFYHWNFSKCNMYVRIINVQTGTHSRSLAYFGMLTVRVLRAWVRRISYNGNSTATWNIPFEVITDSWELQLLSDGTVVDCNRQATIFDTWFQSVT